MIDETVKEIGKTDHSYTVNEINETLEKEIVEQIKESFKEKLFNPERAARETAAEELMDEIFAKHEGKLSKDDMKEIFLES